LASKFGLFSDRFEITYYGGLPHGLFKEVLIKVSILTGKDHVHVFSDMNSDGVFFNALNSCLKMGTSNPILTNS